MLKALRHRGVQRKIFIGLAVIVSLSFVLSGVLLNREDSKTAGALGKIGRKKISVKDYLDSYRAVQHQMQFMFGERWTEMRRYVNLKGEAWDRLLLLEEAKHRGFRATDKEVVDWIAGQSAFQRQGRYYPELYRMGVREALRMEPRDFEEEMRKTLTVQKLSDTIVAGVKIEDAELKELFGKERGVRDLEYFVVPANASDPALTADDKEVEEVYAVVKDHLTSPERVRLRYLIVPQAEAEAKKEILADNSGSLEALAGKAGLAVQTTGYFSRNDAVPQIGLARDVLSAAFTLPAGGESPWIALPDGSSCKIKVDDKQAERPLSLDEARNEVRKQVLERKAVEIAMKKLAGLKPSAEKDGLEAAAKNAGASVQTADAFKAEGYLPGIGPGSMIARQVGLMKEGEISAPLAVMNGAALVRVKKDHTPEDAAFEKDKEEFRKQITARKAQDSMKELLGKLRKDLSLDVERMKEIFPEGEAA